MIELKPSWCKSWWTWGFQQIGLTKDSVLSNECIEEFFGSWSFNTCNWCLASLWSINLYRDCISRNFCLLPINLNSRSSFFAKKNGSSIVFIEFSSEGHVVLYIWVLICLVCSRRQPHLVMVMINGTRTTSHSLSLRKKPFPASRYSLLQRYINFCVCMKILPSFELLRCWPKFDDQCTVIWIDKSWFETWSSGDRGTQGRTRYPPCAFSSLENHKTVAWATYVDFRSEWVLAGHIWK